MRYIKSALTWFGTSIRRNPEKKWNLIKEFLVPAVKLEESSRMGESEIFDGQILETFTIILKGPREKVNRLNCL